MTAIKSTHQFRTALNINPKVLTKNEIYQLLNDTTFKVKDKSDGPVYIIQMINVGMYNIQLECSSATRNKFELTDLKIKIYETASSKEINLIRNSIFKQNEWVKRNQDNTLTLSDLVDAITLCIRLDRMRAFN